MSTSETPPELDARKRRLRSEMRARLRATPPAELLAAGATAGALIAAWLEREAQPGPVALFAARPFEIDTRALDDAMRATGRVRLLPSIHGDRLIFRAVPAAVAICDLPVDRFGIPTPSVEAPPVPLATAVVVVVPACAVDLHGRRLGFGKGYYDRALSSRCQEGRARGTIALVLDAQLVDEVPVGPGDVLVERLCTPARGLCDAMP